MDKYNSNMITRDNYKIFEMLSKYLNEAPDYIQSDEIQQLTSFGITEEYAFALLLASAFQLEPEEKIEDRALFEQYFLNMIHLLDVNIYRNNAYYRNIKLPTIKIGSSELKYERYKPYEAFVCNDIVRTDQGRQLPQIGFFNEHFNYPAVLENDRIWMTITPNEIETMAKSIADAYGEVLVFGLGLGYYPYMVSEKDNVNHITIVELNSDVIQLFEQYILPQFKYRSKITIVHADAFVYAKEKLASGKFNYVFTDLWHDVSDGMELYLQMKSLEPLCKTATYSYWIEPSILCYLTE